MIVLLFLRKRIRLIISILVIALVILGIFYLVAHRDDIENFINDVESVIPYSGSDTAHTVLPNEDYYLPENFDGKHAWVAVDNNVPNFTDTERNETNSYEYYSELDELGRCGTTMACIGVDLMPKDARESISSVTPSGWKYNKKSNNHQYDFVDGKYIYNRCHLIGFQLAGENANERNLITGTRYLNVTGMLPFENMVADYLKEHPKNHVIYRVVPVFEGSNLVAYGVTMEGWSVEDDGAAICFNVFCYNVQPGVEIDYATGENWLAKEKVDVAAAMIWIPKRYFVGMAA